MRKCGKNGFSFGLILGLAVWMQTSVADCPNDPNCPNQSKVVKEDKGTIVIIASELMPAFEDFMAKNNINIKDNDFVKVTNSLSFLNNEQMFKAAGLEPFSVQISVQKVRENLTIKSVVVPRQNMFKPNLKPHEEMLKAPVQRQIQH